MSIITVVGFSKVAARSILRCDLNAINCSNIRQYSLSSNKNAKKACVKMVAAYNARPLRERWAVKAKFRC